jgi:hypothetical protein
MSPPVPHFQRMLESMRHTEKRATGAGKRGRNSASILRTTPPGAGPGPVSDLGLEPCGRVPPAAHSTAPASLPDLPTIGFRLDRPRRPPRRGSTGRVSGRPLPTCHAPTSHTLRRTQTHAAAPTLVRRYWPISRGIKARVRAKFGNCGEIWGRRCMLGVCLITVFADAGLRGLAVCAGSRRARVSASACAR